jgi:hypothetical protein
MLVKLLFFHSVKTRGIGSNATKCRSFRILNSLNSDNTRIKIGNNFSSKIQAAKIPNRICQGGIPAKAMCYTRCVLADFQQLEMQVLHITIMNCNYDNGKVIMTLCVIC